MPGSSQSGLSKALLGVAAFLAAVAAFVFGSSFFPAVTREVLDQPTLQAIAGVTLYFSVGLALSGSPRYRNAAFLLTKEVLVQATRLAESAVGLTGSDVSVTPSKSVDVGHRQDREESFRRESDSLTPLSSENQQAIVDTYIGAINSEIAGSMRHYIDYAIKAAVSRRFEDESVQSLSISQNRLKAASTTVTIRGFINLVIGIVFAIGALALLKDTVDAFTPERFTAITLSAGLYLIGIRLSLALVVTLIAYFFLSLYKKSLEDVKYYNNEITNLSFKSAALFIAQGSADKTAINSAVEKLLQDDRNLISPARDGSTPPIELEKIILAVLEKVPDLKVK